MKYKTKPIDYTGCNEVIAEHLKRGERIYCKLWDSGMGGDAKGYVRDYNVTSRLRYVTDNVDWKNAEPIPFKQRIMPPERAIPVLIAEGWGFDGSGNICAPAVKFCISAFDLYRLGSSVVPGEQWPSCIIEDVEDDQ